MRLAIYSIGLALLLSTGLFAADDVVDPFRDYKGSEEVSAGLRKAVAGFAMAAKGGSVLAYLLPHSVEITSGARPQEQREYGRNINGEFLKNGFSPRVFVVRKDGDDCYLIRTGSSAIWWVETKSGEWKVYSYLDKPIR